MSSSEPAEERMPVSLGSHGLTAPAALPISSLAGSTATPLNASLLHAAHSQLASLQHATGHSHHHHHLLHQQARDVTSQHMRNISLPDALPTSSIATAHPAVSHTAASSGSSQPSPVSHGEPDMSCSFCGKKFKRQRDCMVHERKHTGDKPFVCRFCGRGFTQQGTLIRHERVHTGDKPFKCNYCTKSFREQGNLEAHKRTHTGERPYVCQICGKGFTQKGVLTRHERVHTGDRPYQCQVCGKGFTERGNLNVHMRIHNNNKPFRCSYCNRAFTQRSTLLSHEKTHLSQNRALAPRKIDHRLKSQLQGPSNGTGLVTTTSPRSARKAAPRASMQPGTVLRDLQHQHQIQRSNFPAVSLPRMDDSSRLDSGPTGPSSSLPSAAEKARGYAVSSFSLDRQPQPVSTSVSTSASVSLTAASTNFVAGVPPAYTLPTLYNNHDFGTSLATSQTSSSNQYADMSLFHPHYVQVLQPQHHEQHQHHAAQQTQDYQPHALQHPSAIHGSSGASASTSHRQPHHNEGHHHPHGFHDTDSLLHQTSGGQSSDSSQPHVSTGPQLANPVSLMDAGVLHGPGHLQAPLPNIPHEESSQSHLNDASSPPPAVAATELMEGQDVADTIPQHQPLDEQDLQSHPISTAEHATHRGDGHL